MSAEDDLTYYIIIASFVMPILLSAGLLWFFITYQKKKNEYQLSLKDEELKRQQLIIDKQKALESERTRIAGEMHDDLGGGLTTIRFLSQKVLRKIDDGQRPYIQRIVDNTQQLVENMSEIIWAMNSGFDTLENLIAYTRRYTYEFLEDYDITITFKVQGEISDISLSGEQRRNIFLVIKEALNNTVKHAQASKYLILFDVKNSLNLTLKDNGIGLPQIKTDVGNGLLNMESRIKNLGGSIAIHDQNGVTIKITLPLDINPNEPILSPPP